MTWRLIRPILLYALLRASPVAAAPPQNPAPAFLPQLTQLLAGVSERHATFQETKRLGAVDGVLRDSGTLVYRRPSHLEKITSGPDPERLVVNGNYLSITVGNAPPQVIDLTTQPALQTLIEALRAPLSGDMTRLQQDFSVNVSGALDDWTMVLCPTDPRAARFVHRVRLTGSRATIGSIRIEQENGDESFLTLTNTP